MQNIYFDVHNRKHFFIFYLLQQKRCTFGTMRGRWYMRAFGFFTFVLVFIMVLKFKWIRDKANIELNNQKLMKCIETLEKLRSENEELNDQLSSLDKKYY